MARMIRPLANVHEQLRRLPGIGSKTALRLAYHIIDMPEEEVRRLAETLLEAKRQIDSTLHKLRETVKTLEGKENPARYRSQITLAKRRIQAFTIAVSLIEGELEKLSEAPS